MSQTHVFKCCICLETYAAYVSSGCFKSRSGVARHWWLAESSLPQGFGSYLAPPHATHLTLSSPSPPFPPSRRGSWQFELDLSGIGAGGEGATCVKHKCGSSVWMDAASRAGWERGGGSYVRRGRKRGRPRASTSLCFLCCCTVHIVLLQRSK
jgi:hypothetical protein